MWSTIKEALTDYCALLKLSIRFDGGTNSDQVNVSVTKYGQIYKAA